MPDLSFEIVSANPMRDMVTPALAFDLRVTNRFPEQSIHAMLLRCRIQIEPRQQPSEKAPAITWVNTSLNIPAFSGSTIFPIAVPCTIDFNVATARYFHGLEDGEVPLTFLFSGSVFREAPDGNLRVTPVALNKEAHFRLHVQKWKCLMDLHYPDMAYVNLRRDVFDELHRFTVREGLATFDEAIQQLLHNAQRKRAAP